MQPSDEKQRFDIIFGELGRLMRAICKEALPGLTPDTRLDEVQGLDSLRLLHVISMLEEQLTVEIDNAVLDHPTLVRDIVAAAIAARPASGACAPA